jgi:glutamate-5-semialdehyde dehydrogenase
MNIFTDNAAHSSPALWLNKAATEARVASVRLAQIPDATRAAGLRAAADTLRRQCDAILHANATDLAALDHNGANTTQAFRDRLRLDAARVAAMADALDVVADLPDPLGRVLAEWTRPNGLRIRRIASPIGVIGMIYESRPNVGADAAGLCIKSGNAVLLRGGSESFHSARAIHAALTEGLQAAGLPPDCVQMPPGSDRAYVAVMLQAAGAIDLIIPRGGRSLVERVQNESRVPVLAHAEGLNHTYLHAEAETDMAVRIVLDAKLRRTGVCGATETLLVDAAGAPRLLPPVLAALRARGCQFRADPAARAIDPTLLAAGPSDFDTEWLDAVLSVRVVEGIDEAIAHIARHGSSHTDAIVTQNAAAAETFLARVDSAVTLWNASTQFCDGGEFGFGAEIGIATGRIHARGPVGLEQLTSFRYTVVGNGHIRG